MTLITCEQCRGLSYAPDTVKHEGKQMCRDCYVRCLHARINTLEDAGRDALAVLVHISAMNSDYVAADFAIEKLRKAGIILGGRDERIG